MQEESQTPPVSSPGTPPPDPPDVPEEGTTAGDGVDEAGGEQGVVEGGMERLQKLVKQGKAGIKDYHAEVLLSFETALFPHSYTVHV